MGELGIVPLKSVRVSNTMGRTWAGDRHYLLFLKECFSQAERETLC